MTVKSHGLDGSTQLDDAVRQPNEGRPQKAFSHEKATQ